jgi:hypothetical protein
LGKHHFDAWRRAARVNQDAGWAADGALGAKFHVMASEARPSNGADSRDPRDRHASLAMTEIELFTQKRYHSAVLVNKGANFRSPPRLKKRSPKALHAKMRNLAGRTTRPRGERPGPMRLGRR